MYLYSKNIIFSLSNMVDRVCHGSKVNHICTCKNGVIFNYGIVIRWYHDLQDVSFNFTILRYPMVISWRWHGFQMVNHHIILWLTLIQTCLTMFQLCSQQLGSDSCEVLSRFEMLKPINRKKTGEIYQRELLRLESLTRTYQQKEL